jgi:hypothetical protein
MKNRIKGEMMKKGIAIPYIIALILGIVVVALLGYWFFVLGGTFTGKASITECQTKLSTYCAAFSTAGYPSSNPAFTDSCSSSTVSSTDSPECCSYYTQLRTGTNWELTCRGLLGQ